ncbi:MAG: 3-oxoacyl-ACP reductase FabG [Candidatus Binataceae bacterium]|nr:3-oxoacyl-ACP reductase FabG [Candidatus Binataceae bacterium]
MEFEQQTAVVTGAGRGIGKAIALAFAAKGAEVAALDLDQNSASATAREITRLGGRAFSAAVDVTDQAAVHKAIAAIVSELGKIDILVNNAGIGNTASFLDLTKESWDRLLAVHLSGSFYCSQAAAREMVKRKYGRIVSLSSIAGLMAPPEAAHYAAAKAGIIGLTRAMAMDLAEHGITANAVAPGPVLTEMLREIWDEDGLKERAAHVPVQRLATVEEIARAVLFLAAPDSSYITGTVLPVDGGSVAAGTYMVEKYRRRHSR